MAYMTSRPLTAADADGDERVVEAALRPRTLAEVVGQERVREQLSLLLEAARGRERVPDHVLLSGPPGLGRDGPPRPPPPRPGNPAGGPLRGDPRGPNGGRRALRQRDPPVAAPRG